MCGLKTQTDKQITDSVADGETSPKASLSVFAGKEYCRKYMQPTVNAGLDGRRAPPVWRTAVGDGPSHGVGAVPHIYNQPNYKNSTGRQSLPVLSLLKKPRRHYNSWQLCCRRVVVLCSLRPQAQIKF